MKKNLLLTLALLTSMLASADNELLYGIYRGSGTLTAIGTEKAETYDVAIHLNDPYLVGMEIRGINVPVNTSAKKTSGYKAWLTKELSVTDDSNVASMDFTPDGKWVTVTFATPYVITDAGVYAGYSFTVDEVNTADASDQNRTPLMTIPSTDNQEAFVHSSRTFHKWVSFSEATKAPSFPKNAPALVVRLGGDRIYENAVTLIAPDDLSAYTLVGKSLSLTYTLINHGTAAVKSLDYELEVGNDTIIRKRINPSINGSYYGYQKDQKVTIPAMKTGGTRPITLRLTKVNGVDNQDPVPAATITMGFLSKPPKHKPLMEEYTGTWCGWCPRGMAAMEALATQLGDDFVGVAWHEGDPMQITTSFPNDVNGFPNSFIDRVSGQDPFGGTAGGSLGIKKDLEKRAAVIAPAALELSADWADEAQTKVSVTSRTSFVRDFAKSPYRLTYLLVANDLQGKGKSWAQSNNFAGNTSYSSDPYLGPLAKLAGTIVNMHYNDVVIQFSCAGSQALAESLPTAVQEAVPYEHTYVFDIANNELVQDKTKLRVVAALVNTLSGEVVNAEKAYVGISNAIAGHETGANVVGIRYTDLMGRPVANLREGIYIQTITYSDGKQRSLKSSK
ncbi:MAG: thioredoxin family protein [Bacteroidaceae bacterium]|nr:thioredoxin family protein [Bacteroidaceae bacterium]